MIFLFSILLYHVITNSKLFRLPQLLKISFLMPFHTKKKTKGQFTHGQRWAYLMFNCFRQVLGKFLFVSV